MSFFKSAQHATIEGGQFTSVLRGDAHIHIGDPAKKHQGLVTLRQNVAAGAFHDAAERVDPPKCHPQTRLAILAEIQEWVRNEVDRKSFIMWVYGPAGSGKSAIAQTTAEIFAKERLLVASFFFSRTGIGRSDTSRFIASIAYQLSLSMPEIREYVSSAVDRDQLVFSRTMSSQMEAMIINPMNNAYSDLEQNVAAHPRLVIIDGLDEAEGELSQKELLATLAGSVGQLQIPLIFLVASRPEYVIRQAFNRAPMRFLMQGLALDEHYKPDDDIRTFLTTKFDEIKESHLSRSGLADTWPNAEDMNYLVSKSSGQFIFASTIIKYIDSPRHNPAKRLKIILGLSAVGKDTPFAQLDALYTFILSSVDDIGRVLEILALLFLQTGYDSHLSVDFIEALLGYDTGDVTAALTDMHALVYVPVSAAGDTLHVYHASLHDFLMDKSRSGNFFLDSRVRHTDLAQRILRYMTSALAEEPEGRLASLLEGFISHHLEGVTTEELLIDLMIFPLTTLLDTISAPTFYGTRWDEYFAHLRDERNLTQAHDSVYQRLQSEFDSWIDSRLQRYPSFVQTCISTACAIPVYWNLSYIPDLFEMVAHSLPYSEALALRALDGELFRFQNLSSMRFSEFDRHYVWDSFFRDRSRAVTHFADEEKFRILAEVIVKLVYRREDQLPIKSRDSMDMSDVQWYSSLSLAYNMEYFPPILGAASQSVSLARLLWELVMQGTGDRLSARSQEVMCSASLTYIERCGIIIPEHTHSSQCRICAEYKPVFSQSQPDLVTPDDQQGLEPLQLSLSRSSEVPSSTQCVPDTLSPLSNLHTKTSYQPFDSLPEISNVLPTATLSSRPSVSTPFSSSPPPKAMKQRPFWKRILRSRNEPN